MSTQILITDPLGLRVTQAGDGPDVLLIGGFADVAGVWDPQVSSLAHSFRVTRFDARGIPGSPTPGGPYRLSSLVADAVAVLDAGGIDRAHVVGSSLGGVIAQQLAIHHPDRVASIVLGASWARPDRALRALLSTWRWAADRAGSLGDVLQVAYTSTYAAGAWNSGLVDRRIAAAEAAALGTGDPWKAAREAFIWTSWAALEHDGTSDLPGVHVPALVIAGARDLVLAAHHGQQLAALLPNAVLEVVADAGHRPFEEQPAVCNALIGRFLVRSSLRQPVPA
ncbi:MAG TPA: alpha/beta fold hydrolase [Solirubrobacteraceae bacterium]|jgi:pimeloyl-ACP methyl ester carboxylesterase|nr:alpha/beta fold hydrolase [Solirubrobacteraceae bacterium]